MGAATTAGASTRRRAEASASIGMRERVELADGRLEVPRPARRDRASAPVAAAAERYSAPTKPVVERVADELGARGAPSFCWMCARWDSTVRTLRVELVGDLGVGVAERDQAQHLDLALGEVVGRAARLGRGGGEPRAELAG